jgi:predicted nucleic acid-binding protein
VHVTLDTNILAYAEGVNGEARKQRAYAALLGIADDDLVVPAQALAELFTVLTSHQIVYSSGIIIGRPPCHDASSYAVVESLRSFREVDAWIGSVGAKQSVRPHRPYRSTNLVVSSA